MSVPYVDTHFHIWELEKFQYRYPTPDLTRIYTDMTLDQYTEELQDTPIRNAIFMQVESRVATQEADWLLELAKTCSVVTGIVAGFMLDDPKLVETLDCYQKEQLFVGVRNILGYESEEWLFKDDTVRGLSELVKRGIPYHILTSKENWAVVPKLLELFPQHKFTIDHLGKPFHDLQKVPQWEEWIGQVARFPNVYCKLSSQLLPKLTESQKNGNITLSDRKYVQRCLDAFGVDRCMFGSDWPVCKLSDVATMKEFYDVSIASLDHLTQEERDKIFGKNAISFYNLNIS